MNRKFYNYTCSIHRFGAETLRGSRVENLSTLYTDIPCALWKSTRSYNPTKLAVQTDQNQYEINLLPAYPVIIGDVIVTTIGRFKVDQVIEHHNSRGKLDNIQVFASTTTVSS